MLRLLDAADQKPPAGWIETFTPLGASAHVRINSSAQELCEDWQKLASGRVSLVHKTNFYHWFGALFETAPVGLVAELFAANDLEEQLLLLLRRNPEAREHLKTLPDHLFDGDRGELERLGHVLDIVRVLDAVDAAHDAAEEVRHDNL